MKSFVTYPLEFQPVLFPEKNQSTPSGKLVAHYELFKKIAHLDGAIIKCGITPEEGFERFAMFKKLANRNVDQKLVAFQKLQPIFEEEVSEYGNVTLKVKASSISSAQIKNSLFKKGIDEAVDFVGGRVCHSIPEYLIENPELKISLLNIDLDDYDGTTTALEFFYPRLVPNGILIIDNYYKGQSEFHAVNDFFYSGRVQLKSFSVNRGPHYIVKN